MAPAQRLDEGSDRGVILCGRESGGDLDDWPVTPRWADTTTASSSPALWCFSRMLTTRWIHWASATDVPPNFIKNLILSLTFGRAIYLCNYTIHKIIRCLQMKFVTATCS